MKTYQKVYQLLTEQDDYISGEKLSQKLGLSRTSIWKAIQQLESRGLRISSVQNLGYRLEEGDLLLADYLAEHLPFQIIYREKSSSTQMDARQGIEQGYSEQTLYLAPSQTSAHGRFGRPFFAPKQGGIYMSLHLQPKVTYDQLPPYTLLVAASLIKAIKDLTDKKPQIKWVNDIYLGKQKIAGILTEATSSVESGLITDVIIGIGFNFHITDFPDFLKDKATSLFTQSPTITRNDLIIALWTNFLTIPQEDLLRIYRQNSLVLGKTVRFTQNHQDYEGTALDIDNHGHLRVGLTDGKELWLNSGEVSLTDWD